MKTGHFETDVWSFCPVGESLSVRMIKF